MPTTSLPTVPDLHYAIDVIGDTFKKYATLFAAVDWVALAPIAPIRLDGGVPRALDA